MHLCGPPSYYVPLKKPLASQNQPPMDIKRSLTILLILWSLSFLQLSIPPARTQDWIKESLLIWGHSPGI